MSTTMWLLIHDHDKHKPSKRRESEERKRRVEWVKLSGKETENMTTTMIEEENTEEMITADQVGVGQEMTTIVDDNKV